MLIFSDSGNANSSEKSIIKNKDELSITEHRKMALEIVESGIQRVLPSNIIHEHLKYEAKNKILYVREINSGLKRGYSLLEVEKPQVLWQKPLKRF